MSKVLWIGADAFVRWFCRHSSGRLSNRWSNRWSFRKGQRSGNDTESDAGGENEFEELTAPEHVVPKPSLWRLFRLNSPEWPYAVLGTLGAIMAGGETPLFALAITQMLITFYNPDQDFIKSEVRRICTIFSAATVVTVLIYILQHYYYGIMGERLTMRVREMMFKCESACRFMFMLLFGGLCTVHGAQRRQSRVILVANEILYYIQM